MDNPEYSYLLLTIISKNDENKKHGISHFELCSFFNIGSNLLHHRIKYFKKLPFIKTKEENGGYRQGKRVDYYPDMEGILKCIINTFLKPNINFKKLKKIKYKKNSVEYLKYGVMYPLTIRSLNKIQLNKDVLIQKLLYKYLIKCSEIKEAISLKDIFHNFVFGVGFRYHEELEKSVNSQSNLDVFKGLCFFIILIKSLTSIILFLMFIRN